MPPSLPPYRHLPCPARATAATHWLEMSSSAAEQIYISWLTLLCSLVCMELLEFRGWSWRKVASYFHVSFSLFSLPKNVRGELVSYSWVTSKAGAGWLLRKRMCQQTSKQAASAEIYCCEVEKAVAERTL